MKKTFNSAVEELHLPKPEKSDKKGAAKKKTISFEPSHLLTKIDLSGFHSMNISRSGIKELLESLELMPCMRSLSLRNNNITDEFEHEILSIFDNKTITNVDLS